MNDTGPGHDKGSAVAQDSAFATLLLRLAADGEPAAAYERLRARLIALFRLHLPLEAEGLADESLERLARRLQEGVVIDHPVAYLHGIARLVLLEARKSPLAQRASAEALDRLPAPEQDEDDDDDPEARLALRACLAGLGSENGRLIVSYYDDDGEGRIRRRQQLAARLGLKPNALRNRALRLRASLEACVRQRLKRDASARNDTEPS